MNKILFIFLTVMFIFVFEYPATAQTEQQSGKVATQEGPSVGAKIADVALVRPVCLVGSTISTAAYLVISPLVYAMGLGEPTVRAMVEAPWRFTASRRVGEFDHYKDEQPITGVWDFR
jgi:hypothetical protein